jgi:hypothetical protein
LLSGDLTKLQISFHYLNTVDEEDCTKSLGNREYCSRLHAHLTKNLNWIQQQAFSLDNYGSAYWQAVKTSFAQISGESFGRFH